MRTKTWNNTVFTQIPDGGDVNWPLLTDFLVALADNAQTTNFQKNAIRVATTSPVTVLAASDCAVVTKLTVPGAVAVNLPAGSNGQVFLILDGTSDAGTNNITVTPNGADTINGAATYVISSNRGSIRIQYSATGTDWKVINETFALGTVTANRALVSNGAGAVSAATTTATEIGYVNGVTSAIQTQLNAKQATLSAATPTVSGIVTSYDPAVQSAVVAKSVNYTILDNDGFSSFLCTPGGTNMTLTLPLVANNAGRIIKVIRSDEVSSAGAGKLILDGNGSETISGDTTLSLYSIRDRCTIQCIAGAWYILELVQTEYASNSNTADSDDTTSFFYGVAGSSIPVTLGADRSKRVRFLSSIKASDMMSVEFIDSTAGSQWVNQADASAFGIATECHGGGAQKSYGMQIISETSNTTDMQAFFWRWRSPGATYASTGGDWSTISGCKWRVKKLRIV